MLTVDIATTWDGQPADKAEQCAVHLCHLSADLLSLRVDAPWHGDPPPPTPPGPTRHLWEYEVVELFVAGPGSAYTEIELSPHGHSLVLQLEGVRQVKAELNAKGYVAHILGGRWSGQLLLPRAWLPAGPHRVNATAIHGVGPARRYLSAVPLPGDRPDFHQPAAWPALELG